jgi:hypothetical protein
MVGYLVIATARAILDSYNGLNRLRILFWGTNTSSWDWEVTIPNVTSIRGMKRVGDVVYAVGKRRLSRERNGVSGGAQRRQLAGAETG